MGDVVSTAAELRAIARSARDASGYFPALYARVTERIADEITAGRFADAEGMEHFATTFASYYTRAWHHRESCPRCWQACWDVADDAQLLIVQHLLLGINAHVNHDLALTVVEVAGTDSDLNRIRPDFDAVNDVLAETYTDVLRSLDPVSRWTTRVAAAGGGRLFNFSLRRARDQAWSSAERIHRLRRDEDRAVYQRELDELVSVLAYLITRPPVPLRPLVWVLRRFEHPDARSVTKAVLGEV